jgi:hypothetical protein
MEQQIHVKEETEGTKESPFFWYIGHLGICRFIETFQFLQDE